MPRKSEWIHRIDAALDQLRAFPAPVLDRAALQQLLHLSPRQALRVLHRLAPIRAGTSVLIHRQDLIGKLEALRRRPDIEFEHQRRTRLDEQLLQVRQQLAATRIRIDVPARTTGPTMDTLPAGVDLSPGELRIRFASIDELLRQLLELSQAILSDFERFQQMGGNPA